MDKLREQGAPLKGNDKENGGNHHIKGGRMGRSDTVSL